MDPIAKLEVVLNSLNTALAYALYFKAPEFKELEDMQYKIYHSAPMSCEEMEKLLDKIAHLKSQIVANSYEL